MYRKNLAALDLGTNSCRLMITDANGNMLFRDSVNTKLGEGLFAGGSFTAEAVQRGVACLEQFAEQMKSYSVGSYRAIATAACRMAKNGEDFVRQVKEKSGIILEVINAEEEAGLNLRGAALNADKQQKYLLVYDLGGGSTELTLALNGNKPEILYTLSVPWGARTAAEAYALNAYDAAAALKLRTEIHHYTEKFLRKTDFVSCRGDCCCLATSSTPLRLWSMLNRMAVYDKFCADGQLLKTAELDRLIADIRKMAPEQLAESPYVGKTRALIFNAACVIFQTVYQDLQIAEITASLKGAQEAIIQDLETGNGKAYTIG